MYTYLLVYSTYNQHNAGNTLPRFCISKNTRILELLISFWVSVLSCLLRYKEASLWTTLETEKLIGTSSDGSRIWGGSYWVGEAHLPPLLGESGSMSPPPPGKNGCSEVQFGAFWSSFRVKQNRYTWLTVSCFSTVIVASRGCERWLQY